MKLLSILILLFSVQSFAQSSDVVINGQGSISVHDLHCKLIPGQSTTTIISNQFGPIHIVGLDNVELELEHKLLRVNGCDEQKIASLRENSRQRFMFAPVNYKIIKSVEPVRLVDGRCIDRHLEELTIQFLNGLELVSKEIKNSVPRKCAN